MGPSLVTGVFGLASAVSWGAGDFSGGLAARRAHVLSVAAVAKASALATLAAFAVLRAEPLPATPVLLWAGAAGIAGAIGLVSLYQALAGGLMGVTAPVSAVVAASMPVLFAALWEGLPTAWQYAGFGLAMAGVWFVSRPGEPGPRSGGPARSHAHSGGLWPAVLAGIGFGGFYVLISRARADTVFWPLAASQVVTLCSILAVAGISALVRRRGGGAFASGLLLLMLLAGVLDGGGNAFFLFAEHAGRLDVAAVLASLYPASTVVLARIVLGERVSRTQLIGIAAVLAAIPLIAG